MRTAVVGAFAFAALAACAGKSHEVTDRDSPGAGGVGGQLAEGGGGTGEMPCGLEQEGDVWLENQDQVDALRGVSLLDGNLFVRRTVTDLSPLGCLTEVTRDLWVSEAANLETLDGLESVRSVGGTVYIGWGCDPERETCVGNPSLRSIDALGGLRRAEGLFITASCFGEGSTCVHNDVLERAVLERLSSVKTLWINGNPSLTELRFDALTKLDSLEIIDNPRLPTCEAEWLRDSVGAANIGGTLTIAGNDDTGVCPP